MRWPSVVVASLPGSGPVAIGVVGGVLRARIASEYGVDPETVGLVEVPIASPLKLLRVPRGPLPVPEGVEVPRTASPVEEPVAPARRGDPETAARAAAAARKLGPNRRTEILRWIVAAGVRDCGATYDHDRIMAAAAVQVRHGITESELTSEFGGVPGGNSKRLGELVSGAWLYARGERPSMSTGTPQRVLFPTSGALRWVEDNPTPRQKGGSADVA